MQVSTTFVACEAKATARGTLYRFKESSGQVAVTTEQALASQAQALLNVPVLAEIVEQTSNKINERTGQPYLNRYLNGITAGGSGMIPVTPGSPTPALLAPTPAGNITSVDRSIWVQCASKVAAHLLGYFPQAEQTLTTFDGLVTREYEKYQAHFEGNLNSSAVLDTQFAANGGGQVDTFSPPEDDIPF